MTFYEAKNNWERIDFLLISQVLVADWMSVGIRVLAIPGWKTASDYRPVLAACRAGAKQVLEAVQNYSRLFATAWAWCLADETRCRTFHSRCFCPT
jgi:hypothetical protein